MPAFPKPITEQSAQPAASRKRKSPEELHSYKKLIAYRAEQNDLVTRAANHSQLSVATFIRNASLVAARKILNQE